MIKSKKYILLFSIIFLFFTIFGWEDKTFGADTTLSNGFIFPSTQPGTIGVSDSNGQTSYSTQLPNGTTQTTLYGPNGQTTTTITPTPVQKPQTKAPQTSNTSAKDINYTPLASIPSTNGTGDIGSSPDIGTYFNQMYQLGVGVATALAVLMVIWGGVEYITTDAIGGKEEGKQKVQNAILGLLLALGSYLILQTINPALLNTNLNITKIKTTGAKAPVVSQGGVTNAWAGNWTTSDQKNFDDAYAAMNKGTSFNDLTPDQQAAFYKEQSNQSNQNKINNELSIGNPVSSDASSKTIAANSSKTSDMGWSMSKAAESSLGMNTNIGSQTDYGNLGCGYAVGQIISNGTGEDVSTLSTAELNTKLSNNSNFALVPGGLAEAAPGDIVISPTNGGNTGHTGVIGSSGTIISNSSSRGSVQDNYTATSWNNYYGGKGLQTYVYRAK